MLCKANNLVINKYTVIILVFQIKMEVNRIQVKVLGCMYRYFYMREKKNPACIKNKNIASLLRIISVLTCTVMPCIFIQLCSHQIATDAQQ
jgi:hypothetical protein